MPVLYEYVLYAQINIKTYIMCIVQAILGNLSCIYHKRNKNMFMSYHPSIILRPTICLKYVHMQICFIRFTFIMCVLYVFKL